METTWPLVLAVFVVLIAWAVMRRRPSTKELLVENNEVRAPERTEGREPPPGARPIFHVRYREDFGADTRRDIFPIRMLAVEEGVRAWCYLMGEVRLFKFAQLHGVHDNEAGRDIKVRGLWEWCGLPDTDLVFPDEEPGGIKQTPWQKEPDAPRFRVVMRERGEAQQEVLFAPAAWGSHRRTMQGRAWPAKDVVWIDFADIHEVADLLTGEILDRVSMWKLVLAHRDDVPPWYVQWADQHLMVLCMVSFVRQELGKFQASMRPLVNSALSEAGHSEINDEGFKSISQAVREGYKGRLDLTDQVALLTELERNACRTLARILLTDKSKEPAIADVIFQQTPAP